MKLATLKRKARVGTSHHRMGQFQLVGWQKRHYVAECAYCKAWIQVTENPEPNEIEIGGNAWHMRCQTVMEDWEQFQHMLDDWDYIQNKGWIFVLSQTAVPEEVQQSAANMLSRILHRLGSEQDYARYCAALWLGNNMYSDMDAIAHMEKHLSKLY